MFLASEPVTFPEGEDSLSSALGWDSGDLDLNLAKMQVASVNLGNRPNL